MKCSRIMSIVAVIRTKKSTVISARSLSDMGETSKKNKVKTDWELTFVNQERFLIDFV